MSAAFRFPSWMTAPQTQELESTYADLPQFYDTSGVEQNIGQQQQMNVARGLRMTEAMSRAAQNRAARGGGQVAASFAAGGAMLPIYEQNLASAGQLAQMKLANAQAQIQQRAAIAAQLAQARQSQRSLQAGFYGDTMARQQQESQFGRSLAQDESQFGRNLLQQQRQFDSDLGFRRDSLAQNESQFSRQFGAQQQNTAFERAMQALRMMPTGPMYTEGPNMTSADLTARGIAMNNQMNRRAIQNRIQSLI